MPGRTFCPLSVKIIITFAAAPLVLTPFVRSQGFFSYEVPLGCPPGADRHPAVAAALRVAEIAATLAPGLAGPELRYSYPYPCPPKSSTNVLLYYSIKLFHKLSWAWAWA